jgi:crossover junction endodeoxyribonuclease RuvC
VTRVLGLDLSLRATGYASSAGTGLILPPKGETGIGRIEAIAYGVLDKAEAIDLVAMEGHSFSQRQAFAHEAGEVSGVVKHLLHRQHVQWVEVPPASLKKYCTGKGNAGKDEVIASAIRSLGFEGSNNNEADAWVLYLMAKAWYSPTTEFLPQYRQKVLDSVPWPEVKIPEEELA